MYNQYNKDKEFNKIGLCWLTWNYDFKSMYGLINKLYDEDLYLMYDHKRYVEDRCDKIIRSMKNDVIKQEFENFKRELVNELNCMIYSKEIQEKYEK